MKDIEKMARFDSSIEKSNQTARIDKVKTVEVSESLANLVSEPFFQSKSISQAARHAMSKARPREKRTVAIAIIRLISTEVLDEENLQELRLEIVKFVEKECPDLTRRLFENNEMNHIKLEKLQLIHQNSIEVLQTIQEPFASLKDLASRRQDILRSMKNKKARAYLSEFGFESIQQIVNSILQQVEEVSKAHGHQLQTKMQQLIEDIPNQLESCKSINTFISKDYILPFLEKLEEKCVEKKQKMLSEFSCRISVPTAATNPEKKYPLHQIGLAVKIPVRLKNDGPGVAQSVQTFCAVDSGGEVVNPEMTLGSIEPGWFTLNLEIKVTEPKKELQALVEIKWGIVGEAVRGVEAFTVVVRGQRTDIDWKSLQGQQPYILEAVEEDYSFYGRNEVLNNIVRRITSTPMQSCYVTGQRRVGKSSLAYAVRSKLEQYEGPEQYRVMYLDIGEIRHSTGEQTLSELGNELELFFLANQDNYSNQRSKEYSTSLSPLIKILRSLEKFEVRHIVIIDEFDEINESLYSYGELANTFFLNLRTLASKKNLAFIFVGAERILTSTV